ncbi:MAG: HD domain-containing protein [Draconibacterium sp.]|nr:HD domain-containing protein [Draconibacterium sp.]
MNTGKLKRFITNKLESELSDKLTYHSVHHTLHVLKLCNQYIKRMHIEAHDGYLLRTAALMHDTGFIWDFDKHENASINYTIKLLPAWNYSDHEINMIIEMINATKKPQTPSNILEQILADSDLDYLGTKYFYKVGNKLYTELLAYNKISTEEDWNMIQVQFLREHKYHTPFAIKYREPVKQKYLKEILDKWGWK